MAIFYYYRDRKIHSSHLTQLEQEVECQVKEVEERAVEMVKSEIAAERKSLRQLLQEELDELHKQLQLFQKVGWIIVRQLQQGLQ